jgi:hypothetical protein
MNQVSKHWYLSYLFMENLSQIVWFVCLFWSARDKPRASCMPGKLFNFELLPQPLPHILNAYLEPNTVIKKNVNW